MSNECQIKATFRIPENRKLCLVRVVGVNDSKFFDKKGKLKARYNSLRRDGSRKWPGGWDDTYYRLKGRAKEIGYAVVVVPEDSEHEEQMNFKFEKIKELPVCENEIFFGIKMILGGGWITGRDYPDLIANIEKNIVSAEKASDEAKRGIQALKLLKNSISEGA